MMKAAAGNLVILGLSEGNISRLKQDDPILFSLRELGLDDRLVCISYKRPDGCGGVPKGFQGVAMFFNDKAIDAMRRGHAKLEIDGVTYLTFVGKDEASMELMMREFVNEKTRVTHTGIPPSDIPPSQN